MRIHLVMKQNFASTIPICPQNVVFRHWNNFLIAFDLNKTRKEYTDIPEAFFTPHHVGRCRTDMNRGHCWVLGHSCTVIQLYASWVPRKEMSPGHALWVPGRNNDPWSCRVSTPVGKMTAPAMQVEYPRRNNGPPVMHVEYPLKTRPADRHWGPHKMFFALDRAWSIHKDVRLNFHCFQMLASCKLVMCFFLF
jgi:hypothetical protein